MSQEKRDIIIYMPAYNVESTIEELLLRLDKLYKELEIMNCQISKVIIVDDGSTDKTGDKVKTTEKKVGFEIEYVKKEKNEGPISAIKEGLDRAIKANRNEESIIVRMDSDLEHLPEDIPRMIKPIVENEAQAVVGEMPIDTRNGIGFYLFNKIIGNMESNKYLNMKIAQFCPGFLALSSKNIENIKKEVFLLDQKFQEKYGKEMLGWDFIILVLIKRKFGKIQKIQLKPIEKKYIKKQPLGKIKNYLKYHFLTTEFLDSLTKEDFL
jgi:glycosyltransferase involved in cell wall biosynthesis